MVLGGDPAPYSCGLPDSLACWQFTVAALWQCIDFHTEQTKYKWVSGLHMEVVVVQSFTGYHRI